MTLYWRIGPPELGGLQLKVDLRVARRRLQIARCAGRARGRHGLRRHRVDSAKATTAAAMTARDQNFIRSLGRLPDGLRQAARAPTRPRSARGIATPGSRTPRSRRFSTRISPGLQQPLRARRPGFPSRAPISARSTSPHRSRRQRLAGEVPDHGPQLVVGVEGEAVVDDPHAVLGVEQAVARLAVGVVGDHVEQRDPHPSRRAARACSLRKCRRSASMKSCIAPTPCGACLAHHRRRDARPAEHLAQLDRRRPRAGTACRRRKSHSGDSPRAGL